MRLLTATDYALRALLCLAEQSGRACSTEDLAGWLEVSRHHLHKVVQTLAAGGFVQTTRGAGGGVRLARAATDITIGAVVRHFEQGQPVVECYRSDGGQCCQLEGCRLKPVLGGAREAFFSHLDQVTLAQCARGAALQGDSGQADRDGA